MSGNSVQSTTSVVNNKFLNNVRTGTPHLFGKINKVKDFGYIDWIKLIETHPIEDLNKLENKKKQLKLYKPEKDAIELRHLERRGSMPEWFKDLLGRMEKTFYKNHITALGFGSFGPNASSFRIHRDRMDVIYLQVLGNVKLSLWRPTVPVNPVHNTLVSPEDTFHPRKDSDKAEKFWGRVFSPDELLWIPRGTYHYIEPINTRLAISFGVEGVINPMSYI
jgi:hypothetical protein